jgi:hypothetical protein
LITQQIRMVLEFNEEGVLPEGEHKMSLEEFKDRFVFNQKRAVIFSGLKLLIKDLKSIGCKTIYVDGSYVTNKEEPNDVDVCWDDEGEIDWDLLISDFPILGDLEPPRLSQQRKYCADIFPANILHGSSGKLFKDFFKTNKETGNPKGIIKIAI